MQIIDCTKQQKLYIGDAIVVTILDLSGNAVRLGIEAPKAIEVHREEVYRRIKGLDSTPVAADLLPEGRRLYRRKRRIIHNPTPY